MNTLYTLFWNLDCINCITQHYKHIIIIKRGIRINFTPTLSDIQSLINLCQFILKIHHDKMDFTGNFKKSFKCKYYCFVIHRYDYYFMIMIEKKIYLKRSKHVII